MWFKVLAGAAFVGAVGLGVAGAFVPAQREELLIVGGVLVVVGAFLYFLVRSIERQFANFPGATMIHGDFMRDSVNRMNATTEFLRQQTVSQALQMSGRDAKAHVLAVRDTHQMVNFDPILEFDLVVSDGEREPYRMTCRLIVSKLAVGRIAVGQTYAARVDPENTARIHVAWF